MHAIGKYGLGDRNARGETLAAWVAAQHIILASTIFQKHPDKQWTHAGGTNGENKKANRLRGHRRFEIALGIERWSR